MARPATAAVRLLSGEREPVRVATTANITLQGLQTIDGVALAVNDRVLVKNQTDARFNGIYTASTGSWFRASDARSPRSIAEGVTVQSQDGTVNGGKAWRFANPQPVIGTDNIVIDFYLSATFSADAAAIIAAEKADAIADINAEEASALAAVAASSIAAAISADEAEAARDVALGAVPNVFTLTRVAMAALNPATMTAAYLREAGREGQFIWRTGNYTARVAADPLQGLYVASTVSGFGASVGCWVRSFDGPYNVRWWGAKGDSVTDDTAAVQACFNCVALFPYASVAYVSGSFIHGQISIADVWTKLDIISQGAVIGHKGDNALFSFSTVMTGLTVTGLNIISIDAKTSNNNAAFWFPLGGSQLKFIQCSYNGLGLSSIGKSFFNTAPSVTVDELYFDTLTMQCTGYGIGIGPGSSVLIKDTRIKGLYNEPEFVAENRVSEGIRLYGNQGGVYIVNSDLTGHNYGMRLTQENGTSNREVIIEGVSLDGCGVGYSVEDEYSLTSFAGSPSGSCSKATVSFTPTGDLAKLIYTGGVIGNGGGNAGTVSTDLQVGIYANGKGKMILDGILFEENNGYAIELHNVGTQDYKVTGCQFVNNGGKAGIAAQVFLEGRCIFTENHINTSVYGVGAITTDAATLSLMRIGRNTGVGTGGFGGVTLPTFPASNVAATNTTGRWATLYLRGGAVFEIYVNEIQVDNYSGNAAHAALHLRPGDTFKVAYTTAPVGIQWYFH